MPSALWFKAGSQNNVQKPKHSLGFRGWTFLKLQNWQEAETLDLHWLLFIAKEKRAIVKVSSFDDN